MTGEEDSMSVLGAVKERSPLVAFGSISALLCYTRGCTVQQGIRICKFEERMEYVTD